jgi:outer membrane protein assembly factor BamD
MTMTTRKIALMLAALAVVACSTRRISEMSTTPGRSDRAVWEEGEKLLKKKKWEEARVQLKRLIDGYPNSDYLPEARLATADTYFQQGGNANDVLAISEYRQYLTLYPSSPKADYAQFQIAECYFSQKHGPQRDQTPLRQALDEYQKTIDLHPDSPYAAKAKERLQQGRQTLARADYLVGLFYQRTRQSCRSAVLRFQAVLQEYPEYTGTDEVLLHLGQCLIITGRKPEAAPHLQRLIDSYPKSQFVPEARELLEKVGPPAPAASLK